MRVVVNAIKAVLPGWEKGQGNDLAKKLLLLAVTGFVATVLFFPSFSFFGFDHNPGDVAVMDIKSPVEVSSDGITIRKGETIVRDGQVITEDDVRKFDIIGSVLKEQRALLPAVGFFVFTVVLVSVGCFFATMNIKKFSSRPKDLLLLSLIFISTLLLMRFANSVSFVMKGMFPYVPHSIFRYIIPVAVGPMLVRLLLNSETAFVFAAFNAIMVGFFIGWGGGLDMAAYALVGGLTAAMGVRHCTHRSIALRAGLVLGAVNTVTLLSLSAIKGWSVLLEPIFIVPAGMINGMATAILAIGIAPALESTFRYTTNIKLLELSRMDHPLLKELAVRAPGTYHHSIVIGTLVEAAAESINANPLLARVSAYYHDVGKLKMPDYFIENTSEENKHDKLTPSMSALVLINHIKEGAALAKSYRLGSEITDVINQHHGTSLISFFYQKARALEESETSEVDETDFRYPGPKPQTKEAGLVMLADAIEAASKTLHNPTTDRIQWLTQKIVNKIFTDGQLDECELTLKDLHLITNSFNRVFAGIFHQRIDYPEPGVLKEERFEGDGAGQGEQTGRADEDKKDGRDRLKRLGMQ